MNTSAKTYRSEEFSRRGQEIYDRDVWPKLSPSDMDQFVAIDIGSGDYEIHGNDFEATQRLLARRPSAQIWLTRAGQRTAYRIGGGLVPGEQK